MKINYIKTEDFQDDDQMISEQSESLNLCSSESTLLNREETAKLLRISLSCLHNWCKKGIIKKYGLGGKVYFKKNEVQESLIPLK